MSSSQQKAHARGHYGERRRVKMNWYDNIEEGIRGAVKLLRDNGFNTTCSCGHEEYIQGDLPVDGELRRLHDLLFNNGYRKFSITIVHELNWHGLRRTFFEIHFVGGETK